MTSDERKALRRRAAEADGWILPPVDRNQINNAKRKLDDKRTEFAPEFAVIDRYIGTDAALEWCHRRFFDDIEVFGCGEFRVTISRNCRSYAATAATIDDLHAAIYECGFKAIDGLPDVARDELDELNSELAELEALHKAIDGLTGADADRESNGNETDEDPQ